MKTNKKEIFGIMTITIVSCLILALVETVIEPSYIVKSALKILIFIFLPLIFMKVSNIKVFDGSFALSKKNILKLLLLGCAIYLVVFAAYLLTKNTVDYPALVSSLSQDQKVDSENFIGIALYISFCNSFLEEFLFRLFSFIKLSEYMSKTGAYIFSSVTFALYHIAMVGSSFPLPLMILALVGLAVGGAIFDKVDEKSKNIYNSWFIHMFADLALMTIWYIHI